MQIESDLKMLWTTVKNVFTYSGRATRKEYWTFIISTILVNFILGIFISILGFIAEFLFAAFGIIFGLIILAELLVILSLTVRRLHDINLSGFWLLYLNPVLGLPLVYIIYLLGVDPSCENFVEKVKKVGSPWLGWILLWLFWAVGSIGAMFLLCLCAGKREDNLFGENPYKE